MTEVASRVELELPPSVTAATQLRLQQRVRSLQALGIAPDDETLERLSKAVITIAAWKGGVGKTMLATEIAFLLGMVLLDLDWDLGCASRQMGYDYRRYKGVPLLDALDSGRIPRVVKGKHKADLIPGHPDFGLNQPKAETMAERMEEWSSALGGLMADSHPGGCPSTYGACQAANLIVTPVVLARGELDALEGMLEEMADYRLLIIPNEVTSSPPAALLQRLDELAKRHDVPVGPVVSRYPWHGRRSRRMPVSAGRPSAATTPMVDELSKVARAVVRHAIRA